jgi:NADPH:quinone reductase-like Zn-dependent oxidoreductase
MKAIVYHEYGPAEVLKLAEVAQPTPKDNEVLIKVHASTVTAGDVNARGFTFVPSGFGPLPRLMFGLRRPKQPILGVELSGEIEAVGQDVTLFKQDDQVFGTTGTKLGAYAEYVCLPEDAALMHKPANTT